MTEHKLTEWQQLKNFPDLEQAFFDDLVAKLKEQHDEQMISILINLGKQ